MEAIEEFSTEVGAGVIADGVKVVPVGVRSEALRILSHEVLLGRLLDSMDDEEFVKVAVVGVSNEALRILSHDVLLGRLLDSLELELKVLVTTLKLDR